MPEFPIPPEMVDHAVEAFARKDRLATRNPHAMEAAIREALDKLGLREEWSVWDEFLKTRKVTNHESALAMTFTPGTGRRIESRLVMDWRNVDEDRKDGASLMTAVRVDTELPRRFRISVNPQSRELSVTQTAGAPLLLFYTTDDSLLRSPVVEAVELVRVDSEPSEEKS